MDSSVAVFHWHVNLVKLQLSNGADVDNSEEPFNTRTVELGHEQGREMTMLIGTASGQQWKSTAQERTKKQITTVYNITTVSHR